MSQIESFLKLVTIRNSRTLNNQIKIQFLILLLFIISLIYLFFFTYLIAKKEIWMIAVASTWFFIVLSFFLNIKDREKLSFGHESNIASWKKLQMMISINAIICTILLAFVLQKKSTSQLFASSTEQERETIKFENINNYSIIWVNETDSTMFIKFQHSYYSSNIKIIKNNSIPMEYKSLAKNHWAHIIFKGREGCNRFDNFLPRNFGDKSIFRFVYSKDNQVFLNGIKLNPTKLSNLNCKID